ncbi:MAG: hypothetical protein LBB64_01840 [Dysgonamonadaceae bacterium]|nr:hypothetical protein [Dysgonamonadaceae bacterium]
MKQFINRFYFYCEMKKLVLFAAVVVAISLSGCKKAAPAEEAPVQEEITTVVEEPAADAVEAAEAPADSAESVEAPAQ